MQNPKQHKDELKSEIINMFYYYYAQNVCFGCSYYD